MYLINSVTGKCFCFIRKIARNFHSCLFYEPIKTYTKINLLCYLMTKYAGHIDTPAIS